jgi:hypothetical protein
MKSWWNFFNAWPSKWAGPTFNAKGNDVAIEELTLTCERQQQVAWGAGLLEGRKRLVAATIDLQEITRGKFDLDVAGHHARPDVFGLTVDLASKCAVSTHLTHFVDT